MLLSRMGIAYSISTLFNESLVTRARNTCVAFMMGNLAATHLMFIDADIEWQANSVLKLASLDKDIVGGAYPKKSLPIDFVVNALPGQTGEVVEVHDIGTGFLMIKREVIQKMFDEYPLKKYKNTIGLEPKYNDLCYALFDTMLVNGHYLSEDYGFCHLWKRLGGSIYLVKSIVLGHYGSYMFKGDPNNI
jgi:hypothetical protein